MTEVDMNGSQSATTTVEHVPEVGTLFTSQDGHTPWVELLPLESISSGIAAATMTTGRGAVHHPKGDLPISNDGGNDGRGLHGQKGQDDEDEEND
jgi:hypothetical protein